MTGDERMRKILLALFCVIVCVSPGLCDVPIDESNFPDPNFREWLKYYDCHRVDKDGYEDWHEDYRDGILDDEEIGRIYEFIYHSQEEDGRIRTLEGIKYLTSLAGIHVSHQDIDNLDISGMKNLQSLSFQMPFYRDNDHVSKNDSLEELTLQRVRLPSVNLHGHENIHRFCLLDDDAIKAVDLSGCISLDYVWITDNGGLVSIDFGGCTSLRTVDCDRNAIESINLEGCMNLRFLDCEYNKLEAIDLMQCPNLEELYIHNNKLTYLNLRNNTAANKGRL